MEKIETHDIETESEEGVRLSDESSEIRKLYRVLEITERYCGKDASIALRRQVEEIVRDDVHISGERSMVICLLDLPSSSAYPLVMAEISKLKSGITEDEGKLERKKLVYLKACLTAIDEALSV
ncbi:hypothetical protein [Solimicrobium silvestre]|uniref:Uncharacterized protein n=1 Tax=Solimicrobium silvestre TaxID=2099400 RepID=A0A2S9GT20_9BURK|nr:hypothetical protein [Solimicrobium silvestre]PRC90855.1 hypothetical protein S2091_4436 [Solimicrobium silvestre]